MRCEFLGSNSTHPLIVSASASASQVDSLLKILTLHLNDIGHTIDDLKGIHHFVCVRHILIEDDHKPLIEHQRRLNPKTKEVFKKEILKLLQDDIIYPIFDSK